MRVDFPQGIPEGCMAWLDKHVGSGNTSRYGLDNYDWSYERRYQPNKSQVHAGYAAEGSYIPSITVKDEKKSIFFILRWA